MANTSNKNFPHAYGAGRCIAAFSLSHPGGPESQEEVAEVEPPAISSVDGGDSYPSALAGFPVQTDVLTQDDPGDPASLYTRRMDYRPDHQPLNATSFGVFATGSGLTQLPYRDAIAPFVPNSIASQCPAAAAALPESEGTIKRPFGIVEDVHLGSTRVQAVFTADAVEDNPPEATPYMWYEAALDWKIPDQVISLTAAPDAIGIDLPIFAAAERWASTAVASVRTGLARTMWVNATIGTDCLSEPVPGATDVQAPDSFGLPGPLPADVYSQGIASALTSIPVPGNDAEALYQDQSKGLQGPYAASSLILGSDPALGLPQFPVLPRLPVEGCNEGRPIGAPAFQVRAGIDVLVTGVSYTYTNMDANGSPTLTSTLEGRVSLAPVVRVWCLSLDGALGFACGIPRAGFAPAEEQGTTFQDFGFSPGTINVQVIQKNSSAFDATDTPVYDLGGAWGRLGQGE